MNDVFIVDAVRTPIGAYLGNYKKTESVDLEFLALRTYLKEIKKLIQKK